MTEAIKLVGWLERGRVVGAVLLLLYGRPFTHIAALKTTAIGIEEGGQTTLQLGRGAIPLRSRSARSGSRSATSACSGSEPKAGCSGRHAGTHITADTLRCRLKRYGIERSTEGRHGALRSTRPAASSRE